MARLEQSYWLALPGAISCANLILCPFILRRRVDEINDHSSMKMRGYKVCGTLHGCRILFQRSPRKTRYTNGLKSGPIDFLYRHPSSQALATPDFYCRKAKSCSWVLHVHTRTVSLPVADRLRQGTLFGYSVIGIETTLTATTIHNYNYPSR